MVNIAQQPTDNFDFSAGALCLDFANTATWHASSHPEESLNAYPDLVAWGQAAGMVTAEQASYLLSLAKKKPQDAQACTDQAITLREAIYHLFSAQAAAHALPQSDLHTLNASLKQAMSHLQLRPAPGGFTWDWENEPSALDPMLWPVARSAAELLTSDQVERVGECEDDRGCGFLFLDTSRNRSRRWCSMESCGNRAKAQRHYKRARS